MRIPLDYYRILGLPIQATSDQLRQAHRDRTLQLPRREYSDAAIAARKQLLDQAYAVLVDTSQRQRYDSGFLAKTFELQQDGLSGGDPPLASVSDPDAIVDSHTPSIDIDDDQFIGALLILQELGEYELVLKLGRPFLTGGSASLHDRNYGDPAIVFPDIVLTVALACLELGREQWQQGQYENAAEALETGQQLLLREGLFVNVRGEVQADLYRLRPYRILELLAAPEDYVVERQRGTALLEDMLQERGGINGTQNDQSGLGVDDFLKFIQQLRGYLTAAEQQRLFEREAARPSAVGAYLAVYALLARGFAERQPDLIVQSKQYLALLSNRQDVYLEQAICALLLGQPESASQALNQSREQDSISFIRQHSQGAPDLLPGLCLYTERWFHDEVFPHFRDLAHCRFSLKEYFADRQVQGYLEAIPGDVEEEIVPVPNYAASTARWQRSQAPAPSALAQEDLVMATAQPPRESQAHREISPDHDTLIAAARARIAARNGSATIGGEGRFSGSVSTAERITQESDPDIPVEPPTPSQWSRSHSERLNHGDGSDTMATRKTGDRPPKNRSIRSNTRPARSNGLPGWVLPIGVLIGILAFGGLAMGLIHSLRSSNQTADQGNNEPLAIRLDQPLVELAADTTDPTLVKTIDAASAEKILNLWLSTKAKAMGANYDVAALDQVLTDPKLTEWRNAADEAKRDGWYRTYKHDIKVESVDLIASSTGQVIPAASAKDTATAGSPNAIASPASDLANPSPSAAPDASPSPQSNASPDAASNAAPTQPSPGPTAIADQARVTANVTETTETYRNGKISGAAQTEQLRVQYTLVLKDGKWRIQDWQIL